MYIILYMYIVKIKFVNATPFSFPFLVFGL